MQPEAASQSSKVPASSLARRVHMYLGLFLAPWMVMYALSTVCMNHREFVHSLYPTQASGMVTERELEFSEAFPAGTTPQQMGRQILKDLKLEGAHRVSGGKDGEPLVIDRQQTLGPRRLAWDPNRRILRIQREEFRMSTFLERMHRRRGYQQPYASDDIWAFSVDLAIAAMIFWSLSGLWLCWELRPTRFWGTICGSLGLALFVAFLALI